MSSAEVKIGHEQVFLALSREPLTGLHARLVLPNLLAETQVHLADPAVEANLASFFAGLAEDWRGWKGAREWATYERGLTLTAFAIDHMRSHGMDIAAVETGGDLGHAPARATYEAAGFTPLPVARYFRLLD